AAVLFGRGLFGGVLIARRAPAPPAGDRYVLFLEGADTPTPEEENARVAEYRAWARREAGAGHLLAGEKLDAAAPSLGSGAAAAPGAAAVRGYFVLVAPEEAEARAGAEGRPHRRDGGAAVGRRIAPT